MVWLGATLTGDADVDCWTVRICWPSATLTGRATDFWEVLEVGEATDTTVTCLRQKERVWWQLRGQKPSLRGCVTVCYTHLAGTLKRWNCNLFPRDTLYTGIVGFRQCNGPRGHHRGSLRQDSSCEHATWNLVKREESWCFSTWLWV